MRSILPVTTAFSQPPRLTNLDKWLLGSLSQRSQSTCTCRRGVSYTTSSSPRHLLSRALLLAPVTPTFCPLRGNKAHANRSDELKSELHPDMPPKHTPATNSAADLVGGPGGSLSIMPPFILLHLYIAHAPPCQDARPLTGLDISFPRYLRQLIRCSHASRPSYS